MLVRAAFIWEGPSSETETSGESDGGVLAGDTDLLTCGIVAEDGFGRVVEFEDIHLALSEDLPEGRLDCRSPRMKLQQCHILDIVLELLVVLLLVCVCLCPNVVVVKVSMLMLLSAKKYESGGKRRK